MGCEGGGFARAVLALLVLTGGGGGDAFGQVRGAETRPVQELEAPGGSVSWVSPIFTDRQAERDRMVRTIRLRYGLKDERVLAAMGAVPRHLFVPEAYRSRAYRDTPLPIGYGQTISQPFIVAEMTRLLELKATSKVLEVGTGSGYQAAVLSQLTPNVCTVEIVKPLATAAEETLQRLGYDRISVANRDGYFGWPEKGPFDAIIVTCASGQIPSPLIAQLAPGGRMVIPIGAVFATQSLMLVEKGEEGQIRSRSLMGVRFVPLIRDDPAGL